jgi:hypothetical protein
VSSAAATVRIYRDLRVSITTSDAGHSTRQRPETLIGVASNTNRHRAITCIRKSSKTSCSTSRKQPCRRFSPQRASAGSSPESRSRVRLQLCTPVGPGLCTSDAQSDKGPTTSGGRVCWQNFANHAQEVYVPLHASKANVYVHMHARTRHACREPVTDYQLRVLDHGFRVLDDGF